MNLPLPTRAAFRALMSAWRGPAEIRTPGAVDAPAPMAPAAAALIKSLADYEAPVWLDSTFAKAPAIADWIRFHTGARIVAAPRDAAFALIAGAIPDFAQFAQGSAEYPDRSATLIVQIERFSGRSFLIEGPGIEATRRFAAEPLPADFSARMSANRELFPRGVDLVFAAGGQIAALPRSTRIVEER